MQLPESVKTDVIECLRLLSNLEAQRASWNAGDGAIPDPAEILCQLFDDSYLDGYLKNSDHPDIPPVFSSEVDESLRRLSKLVEQLDVSRPWKFLLRDARWSELCSLAAETVSLLEKSIDNSR